MLGDLHSVLIVAIAATVTALLRFLPFMIFGGNKKTPAIVTYLGRVLPFAIMGMLVVYALRGISFTGMPYGLP
ncbi:MAG: AzlD domain-containing protein, partial [Clostridia bacterium]|nr:AzlD domain-containing protein [Clostridia bacterium]